MTVPARKPDQLLAPLLVSAAEAARLIGVSESTLRRMTAPAGEIPCLKLRTGTPAKGRQARHVARYRLTDLEAWIQRELVQPAAEDSPPG